MKAQNSKEVLIAAKWMLENVGWTQGTSWRNKSGDSFRVFDGKLDNGTYPAFRQIGSMCLAGALDLVDTSDETRILAYQRLYRVLPFNSISITQFNDYERRTKQEVLDVIDQALQLAGK